MNTVYRLKRNTCTGSVKLTYRNGGLFAVETTLKNKLNKQYITVKQVKALFRWLGYVTEESKLADVQAFKVSRLEKALIQNAQSGKNMAIWKKAYQDHFKVSYTHNSKELKLVEALEMTRERVMAYFKCTEWWADRNVIEQFVKVQNELNQHLVKAEAGNPEAVRAQAHTAQQFPNYWDEKLYNLLKTDKKQYLDHLRHHSQYPVRYQHYPYYILGCLSKQEAEQYGYEGVYKEGQLLGFITGHKTLLPPAAEQKPRNLGSLIASTTEKLKVS